MRGITIIYRFSITVTMMLPFRTMKTNTNTGGEHGDTWRTHGVTAMAASKSSAVAAKSLDTSYLTCPDHQRRQQQTGNDSNSTATPPPPTLSPVIIMSEFPGTTGSCKQQGDQLLSVSTGGPSQALPRLLVHGATHWSSTSSPSCLSVPGSWSSHHGCASAVDMAR